ncbi:hypothetical protein SAMN04488588_1768 [Geotoga petraea]|jgi:hypothetical protein|uniref:Uncharacterized protein n=2 Tax=Geotoga petraea TaxID=28234 RepID=A0A1G6P9L0_9BACT|nr:hypothetical protein [Geotoga petraea]MDK2946712.1 hypothetical protein [Geotoga sp.]TGG87950.1 hypothetical protein E4650_06305 [Geotoga petraea]SDC76813.1 hypothetical protein SAMN04488588_1768 [Geotoga petraea]
MSKEFVYMVKRKKYKISHVDMLLWKFPSEFELKKQLFRLSKDKKIKYKKVKSTRSFQYFVLIDKGFYNKILFNIRYDFLIPVQTLFPHFLKGKNPGRYVVKTPFCSYEVLKDVDFITSLKPVEEDEDINILKEDLDDYMNKHFGREENDFIRI